jgi:hypothetical protein
MLDLLHLPKSTPGNVDYFYNTGGPSTSWQTWEKPRGIIMLEIICIGAGGGGRSGWCSNSSVRSGGGGGGSGGFSGLLIPAIFLPDVLYVTVGKGGAGGASATVTGTANLGFDGLFSSVNIAPTNSAFYLVCYANAGAGAVLGSSSASAAGVGAAVALRTSALMSGLGQFSALAGHTGGAGGGGAGGALAYPGTGLLLSGGGGGGGGTNSNAGGAVTTPTQASFSLITTRTGGTSEPFGIPTDGGPGADGISLLQPIMSIGGAGGGASNSNTTGSAGGGNGGNGGLGCGGGGGGAGTVGSGSGAGGKGGDGLVIIRSW